MSRIRVISDGEIVGSIERDTGYHGQAAAHFRLADGSLLAFAYERYQVDDNRRPIANIDMGSADAGSFSRCRHVAGNA